MAASKLSKLTIFGYGLGHVCNDICASMWFTYLLLFFQKVFAVIHCCLDSGSRGLLQVVGASRSDAAVLMLVGQFADGISTTLLGLVADKLGRVPIFRWVMWDLFRINRLLHEQKIREEEKSASVWIPVCVSLISLHIQSASGTDLRVRGDNSYNDAVKTALV